MKKKYAPMKVAVIAAGFLLLTCTAVCQHSTGQATKQTSYQKELSRLSAMLDGTTNAAQTSHVISGFSLTEGNELIEHLPDESLKAFAFHIRLLKNANGVLLAVRYIPFTEDETERNEMTHYFDQSGKTFAFTQHQHGYGIMQPVYGKRTLFFDTRMKITRKTDSFVYANGKPAHQDDYLVLENSSGHYSSSKEFLSMLDSLPKISLTSALTKHNYFQITGRSFKKIGTTKKALNSDWNTTGAQAPDTLVWFNNLAAGLNYARENFKYLLLYYEPANCLECFGDFDRALSTVNQRQRLFEPEIFNENFVLVKATEADTMLLKNAGVFGFPGGAFLSADKKPLVTASKTSIDELFLDLTRSVRVSNQHKDDMHLHYLSNHASELIRQSNFNPQLVRQYLQTSIENKDKLYSLSEEQQDQAIISPVVQILPADEKRNALPLPEKGEKYKTDTQLPPAVDYEIADEVPRFSKLNLKIDSAFLLEALDSFVIKNSRPDLSTAGLVVQIYHLIGMSHYPVIPSPFLVKNDTAFAPAASYRYLLKNFQQFKNIAFSFDYRRDFGRQYTATAYEVLNRPLSGLIYNRYVSAALHRKALLLQKEVVDAIPGLEILGKTALINNLIAHADSLSLHDVLLSVGVPFATRLESAKPSLAAFLATTANTLSTNYPKETAFVINQFRSEYDASVKVTPATTMNHLKKTISSMLNNIAWYLYETKSRHQLLGEATRYIKAALQLRPTDPYILDTYAHLLYANGNRKAAIATDQKALQSVLREIKRNTFDEEWRTLAETIKVSLSKMKAGTLE